MLIGSLEQLSQDTNIEPINEPDLDVENLTIPDFGDFEYEFQVEVRPNFDLPSYDQISIKRPNREVSETDIDEAQQRFLEQYAEHVPTDAAAESGDFVRLSATFNYKGEELRAVANLSVRVRSILRFEDGEVADFDKLMIGVKKGDTRQGTVTISREAENISMRGEKVQIDFEVLEVNRVKLPEINRALLQRVGVETLDELRLELEQALQRQVQYDQRQAVRKQVLEKITESAAWELPEDLDLFVRRQVEVGANFDLELVFKVTEFGNRQIFDIQVRLVDRLNVRVLRQLLQAADKHLLLEFVHQLAAKFLRHNFSRSLARTETRHGGSRLHLVEYEVTDMSDVRFGNIDANVLLARANVADINTQRHSPCGRLNFGGARRNVSGFSGCGFRFGDGSHLESFSCGVGA